MCLHPTGNASLFSGLPEGCSQSLTDQLTSCVEAWEIKFKKRRHFCCQHSKSTHPHAQDLPWTAFRTLWQKLQTVTVATGRGLLSASFEQRKCKGEPAALSHQHATLKPKQIQGESWLCTRLRFRNGVLTNPWLRIQDRQSGLWPDPVLPFLNWGASGSLPQQSCTLLRL